MIMQDTLPANPRAALLTASACCALIVLDTNIVAVALPAIATDLSATFVEIEWVVSAYMLAFAAGLLSGGALADSYGRRRMLLVGLALFVVASLGCGLAQTALQLNVARAAKGVGAALLLPAALASIAHAFHEEAARARAWAFWGACMGVAMMIAPALGGAISQGLGWRWVFLLNLPVGAMLAWSVWRHVAPSRDPGAARLDFWGSLFFCASLFLLIWALIDANQLGWSHAATWGRLAGSAALLALFVLVERLQQRPMVDLTLLRIPRLRGALLAMAAYAGCAQVMMTLMPFYLQISLDFPGLQAGLGMLPFAVTLLLFPRVGVSLSRRLSPGAMLATGLALVGTGNLLAAWAAWAGGYLPFALAMAVTGSGAGLLNGDTQKNIMACIPRDRAGMASGMSTTTRFTAIVLAFALLSALLAHQAETRLSRELGVTAHADGLAGRIVARLAGGDLAGAMQEAPASQQTMLAPLARQAYAQGFAWALLAAGIMAWLAAWRVRSLMRHPLPGASTPSGAGPSPTKRSPTPGSVTM